MIWIFTWKLRKKRFTDMIEYFQKLLTILPQELLDLLCKCTSMRENGKYVYEGYRVSPYEPRGGETVWFDFRHSDILWWRKRFFERHILVKPIDQIQNNVNLFILKVIECNKSIIEDNEEIRFIYLGIKEATEKGEYYL